MHLYLDFFRLGDACKDNGVLPGLFKGLTCTGGDVRINSVSDLLIVVVNAVQIGIALSGGLAVIAILVASVFYIISAGDPSKTKQAKDIIQNTVMGLAVIILAYAIVGLIAKGL